MGMLAIDWGLERVDDNLSHNGERDVGTQLS